MLKGKRFQSLKDQKLVTVVDDNGIWVTLDDSTNIKTDNFLQKYSEYFEAENFFNSDPVMERLAQQFNEKVNINTTPIVGPSGMEMSGANNPAGIYIDDESPEAIEMRKRELLANFQQNYQPPIVQNVIDESIVGNPNYRQQPQQLQRRERQNYTPPESNTEVRNLTTGETIIKPNVQQASYTEEQPVDINNMFEQINPVQPPYQPPVQSTVQQLYQPPVQQPYIPQPVQPIQQQSPEQEAFMFFKKFKKIFPVDINLTFNEMIAEPTYVRQTAMNFDGDIIKFYTRELMNKLWDNPDLLEKQIYNCFSKIIMGETLEETIQSTIEKIDNIDYSEYGDDVTEPPITYANYIAESEEKPEELKSKIVEKSEKMKTINSLDLEKLKEDLEKSEKIKKNNE